MYVDVRADLVFAGKWRQLDLKFFILCLLINEMHTFFF